MAQYRKKPVVIEATQWFRNGDHPEDYPVFMHDREAREHGAEGDIVRYYRRPDDDPQRLCATCGNTMHAHGWIDTAEGGHVVCPGDYIITDERARPGHHGYYYPCKPDIFEQTYEPVTENTAIPDDYLPSLGLVSVEQFEQICRTHHERYVRPSVIRPGYHAPTDCPEYTGGPPQKAYCDLCRLAALSWTQLPECRREAAREWIQQVCTVLHIVRDGLPTQ